MIRELKEVSFKEIDGYSKEKFYEVERVALEMTRFPEEDEDIVKFKKLLKYVIDAESNRAELERLKNIDK